MNLLIGRSAGSRILLRSLGGAGLALVVLMLTPTLALGHPLGNFTINRYDGLTIAPGHAVIDHVLDMAEIPAFQERQDIDVDGDREVSPAEGATWAERRCRETASDLELIVDGSEAEVALTGLGLSFPPGQGGLLTLRLVCTYQADLPTLDGPTEMTFRDETYAGRLGWREIVVSGDGVTLSGAEAYQAGSSQRLTAYPAAQLAQPRDQGEAMFSAMPGGATVPPAPVPDAVPLGSPPERIVGANTSGAAVPGGVVELPPEINELIQARDLTPVAIILSLLVAAGVGAVHAASPGHGKTLMAAYLVGTRGTMRHALGLGLTVTISHTIGVFALGAIILFAGSILPSERLLPILGVVSGLVVLAIGIGLLGQRVREDRQRRSLHDRRRHHLHEEAHDHAHEGGHDHTHDHAHDAGHDHAHDAGHDHAHHAGPALEPDPDAVGGWHSHGLVRHTHLPQGGDPLRWRNLFALGLVGGLVPSASAILILVGSIAAGRPGYGMVLTFAFGLGMAAVLVGVGVLLVRARGLLERVPRGDRFAPLVARLPLLTVITFLIVGTVITVQAGMQLR